MPRMTALVDAFQVSVHWAYYPPYHSQYNPIERVWGVVEKRWNGRLRDTICTVFNFAHNLIWKGGPPRVVQRVNKGYSTGVRLTQQAMSLLEQRFERLPGLDKWFVRISPVSV